MDGSETVFSHCCCCRMCKGSSSVYKYAAKVKARMQPHKFDDHSKRKTKNRYKVWSPKKFGSSVKKVPVTTYRSRLESVCYPASEPSEPLSTSSPPEHNTSGEAGTFRNFFG